MEPDAAEVKGAARDELVIGFDRGAEDADPKLSEGRRDRRDLAFEVVSAGCVDIMFRCKSGDGIGCGGGDCARKDL